MQAWNNLAIVFATFEQAGANLEVERVLRENLHYADVRAAVEEFNEAQQNQERTQGELKDPRECLDSAFAEFEEANLNLEDAGKRITETKRKSR